MIKMNSLSLPKNCKNKLLSKIQERLSLLNFGSYENRMESFEIEIFEILEFEPHLDFNATE